MVTSKTYTRGLRWAPLALIAALSALVGSACSGVDDVNTANTSKGHSGGEAGEAGEAATGASGDGGTPGNGGSGTDGGSSATLGGSSATPGGSSATAGGEPAAGGRGGDQPCVPSTLDCTSAEDNDCSGMPDNVECTGCTREDDTEAVIDDTESCFTFPAPATATGVCKAGTRTCAATADKTALEWGPCEGEVGPTSETDSCKPLENGDENCDGKTRDGCPCKPGDPPRACGSCGGMETCTADLQWGACSVATPGNLGTACDAGCGKIQCDGKCSTSGHGGSCGSCGGKVQCNGTCSVATPASFGQVCDSGCGTIQCNGTCSTSGHGGSCGSCGGKVQCNGTCSVGTPGNLGQACDSGCGTIQCNGQCNTSGHGGSCGSCGGTVQCNGACSVGTPGNLGQACNQCGSGQIQCNGACNATCDVNHDGTSVAVGWGYCAPKKEAASSGVTCPSGTTPVYCSMGWSAGYWGDVYDEGDGTTRIYNGKGDIDALWSGSTCYLYIRSFNCEATTAFPIVVCRG